MCIFINQIENQWCFDLFQKAKLKEAFDKLKDSKDFKFDASMMNEMPELVKGPILPCIIGMCGSGVAFMKVSHKTLILMLKIVVLNLFQEL